jgi:multiple sugar transport system ATP-binding protein
MLDRGTLHLPFGSAELPDALRSRLRSSSGEVVAGLRPEHFGDANGDVPSGAISFRTRIDLVESLGSEVHAHFETTDGVLCARIALPTPVRGGENADLLLDTTRISLFDAASEESLLTPAPAIPGSMS